MFWNIYFLTCNGTIKMYGASLILFSVQIAFFSIEIKFVFVLCLELWNFTILSLSCTSFHFPYVCGVFRFEVFFLDICFVLALW